MKVHGRAMGWRYPIRDDRKIIGIKPNVAPVHAGDLGVEPKEDLTYGIGAAVFLKGSQGLPRYNGRVAKVIDHDLFEKSTL